ncbi:MAG: hypothetical protein ACLRWP_03730 [Bilophila wadsworthia]
MKSPRRWRRPVLPTRIAGLWWRFSRTVSRGQALFGEFCHVLGTVDKLLLTEIYPASEKPIPGVNGQNLRRASGRCRTRT